MIFDFAPQVEIGGEILSRRGDDQRFDQPRPAVHRRRERDRDYHAEDGVEEPEDRHA